MNNSLETIGVVYTHTRNFLKNKKGVSLIALVITIIVIIILATIAFNGSTSTISKANYSKFVSNIREVQDAIQQKAVITRGYALARGKKLTDGQVYNYIAKGGTTDADYLTIAETPEYTIIEETADIGIDLPEIKVNTPTETGAEVKYAVTSEGEVFIWPPYPYEGNYNIRDNETVNKSTLETVGTIDIKVAGKDITIKTDENGMLENTTGSGVETGPTQEEILAKIKVGDYVNYVPTSSTITTDKNKTGYTSAQTLTTDRSAKWRIIDIDEDTGKVLITTEGPVNSVTLKGLTGYLYGAEELNRLCDRLYSANGFTARSMTIEDLDKATGNSAPANNIRFAWYTSDATDADLKDVTAGGKVYTARRHYAMSSKSSKPRFYEWDDENGVTHTAKNENGYNDNISATTPILVSRTWYWYNPGAGNAVINEILGGDETHRGWLASSSVGLRSDIEYAGFEVRTAYSGNADGYLLYGSAGHVNAPSFGLRPVVSLSSKLLDIADSSKDGQSLGTAWEIK